MFLKQKSGFTIAEILITLLIIGVVAALTIPQLLTASEDASNLGRFKKVYGELSQAVNQLELENGGYVNTNSTTLLLDEFRKKINFVKTGTWGSITTLTDGFYYSCYKEPNSTNQCGNSAPNTGWRRLPNNSGTPAGVVGSGAFVFIRNTNTTCTAPTNRIRLSAAEPNPPILCSEIEVDVNGDQHPNMMGKDFFLLVLVKVDGDYRIYPSGFGAMGCISGYPDNYNNSLGCAARALKGGNMP